MADPDPPEEDRIIKLVRPIDLQFVGLTALAIALVGSTAIAADTWRGVKEKPFERAIEVTGSAKKRISSDLIHWSASVDARAPERTDAYKTLHQHIDATIAFLKQQGIKDKEIVPQSVSFEQLFDTEVRVVNEERIEKQIPAGWSITQTISVTSTDVAVVERASREVTSLLAQGISVRSEPPAYIYTKLGDLKIELLAAAAKDARSRADQIVRSAGGAQISHLINADMGVINVNPANSSTTSWEGNNDTTSFEKDILTIIHAKFALK